MGQRIKFGMTINYIVMAHKEPGQVRRLVERLDTSYSNFYVHIDINVDILPFEEVLKNYKNVFLLDKEKRVASTWASPGLVRATLNAMSKIMDEERTGYTVLLSGQCYPIKSNNFIATFLKENYGVNFIEGFSLPDIRWGSTDARLHFYTFFMSEKKGDFVSLPSLFDQSMKSFFKKKLFKKYCKVFLYFPFQSRVLFQKRKIPYGLKPYGGMQWWALPNDTIRFILRYLDQNPEYLKFHQYTLFGDEVFFQTLVCNYFDNIQDTVAYSPWPGIDICSSPKTFTAADFDLLKGRQELFARKFDYDVDSSILDLLDEYMMKQKAL
jgi:hypothetical protein